MKKISIDQNISKIRNPIKEYVSHKTGEITYYFSINFGKLEGSLKPFITKRRGFKTRKEAKAAYNLIKSRAAIGIYPQSIIDKINAQQGKTIHAGTLFKDYYETFLASYVSNSKTLTTIDKTKGYFKNHIIPYFGEIPLNKITPLICRKFSLEIKEKLKSSHRHVLIYLKMFLNDAVKMEVLEKNPMEKVDIPTNKQVLNEQKIAGEEDVFFSNYYKVDELKKFLSHTKKYANLKHHTFFLLLAHTGLRRGEAFALNWEDIDFDKKLVTVNKAVGYASTVGVYLKATKNYESRKVTVDQNTLDTLAAWKKTQQRELNFKGLYVKSDKKQYIFENTFNEVSSTNNATRWLNSIYKSLDLRKITTHGFRHTHCTLTLQSRAFSIEQVMHRLGHKDIKVTLDVYRHVTVEEMEGNADMYKAYLNSH